MRGHRLSGPVGALLAGGVVADSEHEIELRRAGLCELVPRLRAQARHVEVRPLQQVEREGVHLAARVAPGRERLEASLALTVHHALGDDRAGGVARAEKQHVEGTLGFSRIHRSSPGRMDGGRIRSSPVGFRRSARRPRGDRCSSRSAGSRRGRACPRGRRCRGSNGRP